MDFGPMPLANALTPDAQSALNAPRFEQKLMLCESCRLGQLSLTVPPGILYKDYVYKSSVSAVFREHCKDFAGSLKTAGLDYPERRGVIVDIAGNDGCLANAILEKFPSARVFVVDPAQTDEPGGYRKIRAFWNAETAEKFILENGKAGIITAQNVVGHVDQVVEFFRGVRNALHENGLFVVEVPSFVHMLFNGAWDTVYHEHLSYWSVSAMIALAGRTGLDVRNVMFYPNLHCGTLRFWMTPGTGFKHKTEVFQGMLDDEERFFSNPVNLSDFRLAAELSAIRALKLIESVGGFSEIIGVTASAKSNVFLNYMESFREPRAFLQPFHDSLSYLVDDAETKHGKFSPGVGLEIMPFTEDSVRGADIALILSRNITVPMIEKLRWLGFRGQVFAV